MLENYMNKKEMISKLKIEYERDFTGWDFSYLDGKVIEDPLPWNYRNIIESYCKGKSNLLDMGTGGGEFLSSIKNLPKNTFATEAYIPNVSIAKKRLSKKGIEVFQVENGELNLPFKDHEFSLIINKHECYDEQELSRILKEGGKFITQQVGGLNDINLNATFETDLKYFKWNLINAKERLVRAGFKVTKSDEYIGKFRLYSIESLVYYLKCIPWQIEDFSVVKYESKLWNIYEEIEDKGYFDSILHRFILIAEK